MNLPVLVLAAGRGTRLDPLTRLAAKPAMPVGDRTLVERVLSWLREEGARHVVLNLHHRPASITRVVGDGSHHGLSVRYSWEQPLLGSAGGPRRALPLLDAHVFVIANGDTLCRVDLSALIDAHLHSDADVTMAVAPNVAPDRYGGLRLAADGSVTRFVPRGQADGSWHFVGIQVVHARVFAALTNGSPAETVGGLYRNLIETTPGRIRTFRTDADFLDVGTPREYLEAALRYAPPPVSGQSLSSARLVRSVVWPDVVLGRDVDLEDCIAAGPLSLPNGFRARSAVLLPSAMARESDDVTRRGEVALFPLPPAS